ncbi:MAG: hypothetical protein HQK51_03565 [Oligoflexia bacterium]|nr:hypothetical protein [Oligoflexia bacterium]
MKALKKDLSNQAALSEKEKKWEFGVDDTETWPKNNIFYYFSWKYRSKIRLYFYLSRYLYFFYSSLPVVQFFYNRIAFFTP